MFIYNGFKAIKEDRAWTILNKDNQNVAWVKGTKQNAMSIINHLKRKSEEV